jgi:CRISPR-associated protein Cas1
MRARAHDYSVMEKINQLKDRKRLVTYEGHRTKYYFKQVLELFVESLRPTRRMTFKAYDGLNNLLNLAYEILKWKVHIAIIKAKLEPYLGFLHSVQWGKPSLVCDFQELYRYLVDDFVIQYCRKLTAKDFILKAEKFSRNKKGKREYLNDVKTGDFTRKLNAYFKSEVEIPRIKVGKKQEIETLINEEALLFAKYLRNERKTWKPRIVVL